MRKGRVRGLSTRPVFAASVRTRAHGTGNSERVEGAVDGALCTPYGSAVPYSPSNFFPFPPMIFALAVSSSVSSAATWPMGSNSAMSKG